MCFYFYNKDILVKDFRGVEFELPYNYEECEIRGFLNYTGNNLKLDVSRNEIIEGEKFIRKSIRTFILQQKIKFEKSSQMIDILKCMIEYENTK